MSTLDIDLTLSAAPASANGSVQAPSEVARNRFGEAVPSSVTVESAEASCVGSSWDLLSGLDVVESEPGELFDEFFDSQSGAAREFEEPNELSKDQWLLAFAVELAELDRRLEPRDVIRLANVLWRKKQHLAPQAVARDVYSTGWMLRRGRRKESSLTS
jgi:hypothetical protein